MTSPEEGVWFDINARGVQLRTAWPKADSELAFLVFDRNANGLVDDGSELFGSAAPLPSGRTARNGFLALAALEAGSSSVDGQIDANDGVYFVLQLWIDRNHNGVSDPGELQWLRDAGVIAIHLDYKELHRRDRYGNVFRFVGDVDIQNDAQVVKRNAYDVFFRQLPSQ